MTAPVHGTVTVTRDLEDPPERVWAAFAELELRDHWFAIPGGEAEHELDFRIGGGETAIGVFAPSGAAEAVEWRSRIFDLQEPHRLVFAYELVVDGVRRTVSLVTVLLAPEGGGTRLDYTEQYTLLAFTEIEGQDEAHLRGSLPLLLNRLEAALDVRGAPARSR
ncbi:SRPBCC domain-containing protein [Glycomyces sp. TRM65418]|uniref:SRPBCC domain-containing protein n=1 Tax=Glycomyces sp. TRM65418 TaxID=2867006 RepID=UPI001CE6DEB4|nr:SRPBCC domain-containing protein [Glycomyces sp. TRM65418]MCC3762257.1 SRPBCC domain-containing protein [Glycomyces sp. TRM65418]QZD56314.1 SRPBCC domain-containing protein [Glycomyces sp. TRM65418]